MSETTTEASTPKTCAHCGAKIVQYKHTLTPGLVSGLKKLYDRTLNPINISELALTRNEWDNFQKLKYWQLVSKVGGKKSGVWQITRAGIDFIEGKLTCHKSVWTYRGEIKEHLGRMVSFKDVVKPPKNQPADKYQTEYESRPNAALAL